MRGDPLQIRRKRPATNQAVQPPVTSHCRVIGKPRCPLICVDAVLSSALLTQDKELAGILHEVEEISKSLKSATPDNRALSETLQRTVLCALKQSLLDKELRSLALTDDLTCKFSINPARAFLALGAQQLKVLFRAGRTRHFCCSLPMSTISKRSMIPTGTGKVTSRWFAPPTHWSRHFATRIFLPALVAMNSRCWRSTLRLSIRK